VHQQRSPLLTRAQAWDVFQCALEWLGEQGDTDPAQLMLVNKWRDLAAQCRAQSMKQS